ncbi:hypothetical protein IE077_002613, partial [Cardiosporidium cionae]
KPTSIVYEKWPVFDEPADAVKHRQFSSIIRVVEEFRRAKEKLLTPRKNKKNVTQNIQPPKGFSHARIMISRSFQPWQRKVLSILLTILDDNDSFPVNVIALVRQNLKEFQWESSIEQQALSFANYQIKEEYPVHGRIIFEQELPFDEESLFQYFKYYICQSLEINDVEIEEVKENDGLSMDSKYAIATPGKPTIIFS